jgi:phosphohistidine phosphatase
MERIIYVLRHGIAGPVPAGMSDSDRALTTEGKRRMEHVAAGLKRLGIAPDVILSSPLRRAQETAAIVASVLVHELAVETYDRLAPGHEAAEVLRGLLRYRSARHLMLVGHQPGLGQLISQVLTGSPALLALELKKGGAAAIAAAKIPPSSAGVLQWLLTAKQLRAVARR